MNIKKNIEDFSILVNSFIDLSPYKVAILKYKNWKRHREMDFKVGDCVYSKGTDRFGSIKSISVDNRTGVSYSIHWENEYYPTPGTTFPDNIRKTTKQERFIFTLGLRERKAPKDLQNAISMGHNVGMCPK